MPHFSLMVGGMSCRRCVREVTALLRDVEGVETVTADAGSSMVSVTGSMSLTDVIDVLAGSSYSAYAVDSDGAPL